jgi:hypothetical protein
MIWKEIWEETGDKETDSMLIVYVADSKWF